MELLKNCSKITFSLKLGLNIITIFIRVFCIAVTLTLFSINVKQYVNNKRLNFSLGISR